MCWMPGSNTGLRVSRQPHHSLTTGPSKKKRTGTSRMISHNLMVNGYFSNTRPDSFMITGNLDTVIFVLKICKSFCDMVDNSGEALSCSLSSFKTELAPRHIIIRDLKRPCDICHIAGHWNILCTDRFDTLMWFHTVLVHICGVLT